MLIELKNINQKMFKVKGVSLIELVMSMVILSIIFSIFAITFQISIRVPSRKNIKLASDIASNYLNEILSKDFPKVFPCPTLSDTSIRSSYTNICDYNNLTDYGAKDYLGIQIPGLENFNVNVKVYTLSDVSLGNLKGADDLNIQPQVARIDVTVANANIPSIFISTYKGNY